jgi:hypothetical protein
LPNAADTKVHRNVVVSGNTFRYRTGRWQNSGLPESAVWVLNAGVTTVVRDNIFFYPTALPPSGSYPGGVQAWVPRSGYDIINSGTVCRDRTTDAVAVGATNQQVDFGPGSTNLTIPY